MGEKERRFAYFLHVQLQFVALFAAVQPLFAVVVRSVYASIHLLTIAWQLLVPMRLEGVCPKAASKAIGAMASSKEVGMLLGRLPQAIHQQFVVVATAAIVPQLLLDPSACVY